MAYGPIDFIAMEFKGNQFDGSIMNDLTDLVADELIRILDLVIVRKDEQGKVVVRELQEAEPQTVKMFNPLKAQISGMVKVDDIKMIGEKLENNTTAAVMLFEHLWAVQLKEDLIKANGRLLMNERIPYKVVEQALAGLELPDRNSAGALISTDSTPAVVDGTAVDAGVPQEQPVENEQGDDAPPAPAAP
jgi:hypothetical protein